MRFLDANSEIADEIEGKIRDYYKKLTDYNDTAQIGTPVEADKPQEVEIPNIDDDDLITEIPDDL